MLTAMTTGKVRFLVFVDMDDDCIFDSEMTRLGLQTHSFFWEHLNALTNLGAQLAEPSKTVADIVRFEVGSLAYAELKRRKKDRPQATQPRWLAAGATPRKLPAGGVRLPVRRLSWPPQLLLE